MDISPCYFDDSVTIGSLSLIIQANALVKTYYSVKWIPIAMSFR